MDAYKTGHFYWVLLANDPDAENDWENGKMPAVYLGNSKWQTISGDLIDPTDPESWAISWIGEEIVCV